PGGAASREPDWDVVIASARLESAYSGLFSCSIFRAMKITVEINPEDLAVITEQVMKAAGPEAISKIWMAIGDQIAAQIHAQMLAQMPDAFWPFFEMRSKPKSSDKS